MTASIPVLPSFMPQHFIRKLHWIECREPVVESLFPGDTIMNTRLGLTVHLHVPFDAAIALATEALKAEGFGILTEIDVKETMKKKLGAELSPYKILGACNAPIAHRALSLAPEVGLLLPCNVIVRHLNEMESEVSLVDPLMMLGVLGRPELNDVAMEARAKLERVAEALKK
jgi:uncharacterized protein (DUF302 family)